MLRVLITDRVSTRGNAIASVRQSVVCFNSLFRTDWPLALILCMCVGHYHDWHGLKLKVTGQGQDAVCLTSIVDRRQFSSRSCHGSWTHLRYSCPETVMTLFLSTERHAVCRLLNKETAESLVHTFVVTVDQCIGFSGFSSFQWMGQPRKLSLLIRSSGPHL